MAVLIGIATWGVQLTGDPAEHAIACMPDFQRRLVHPHEEAAQISTLVIGLSAVLALVTLLLMRRRACSRSRPCWRRWPASAWSRAPRCWAARSATPRPAPAGFSRPRPATGGNAGGGSG